MPTSDAAEDEDRHALQDQQAAQGDDERRHLQPGDQSFPGWRRPPEQASSVTMIATHHGEVRAGRLHKLGDHDAAEPHDQADGQVDLAEEQGEDLSHRQQHVHGALLEEVDEVL